LAVGLLVTDVLTSEIIPEVLAGPLVKSAMLITEVTAEFDYTLTHEEPLQ
jgi:hypothetical protein